VFQIDDSYSFEYYVSRKRDAVMSVLDSITKWAGEDLSNWQSDAVRRLLTKDDLTAEDKNELMVMLKSRNHIIDENNTSHSPQPLKKGDISGVPKVSVEVTLKAMEDLTNVNAIPEGASLPFGHEGLSVIYGENATGKSGYARVLKRACKARDTSERIHPNIYNNIQYGPAKATFKISIDNGPDRELKWEDGQKGSDELANIAVFDSKCARIIIDEKNEIAYQPYGSHVFTELVGLLQEFRTILETEKPKPVTLHYDDIASETEAGQFISKLSCKTSNASVEEFAKWTSEDQKKLTELETHIAKAQADDPIKQAETIRNRKGRLNELKSKIDQIYSNLSESKIKDLKQQIKVLSAAEQALVIASRQSLANEPLPGTGGNAWQRLYEAAKQYSIQEAYPGKDFPQTEEDSRCVFCMELLSGDGRNRLQRFKAFMEKTTKKEVDSAIKELENSLQKVKELDFTICETYKDVLDEIRNRDKTTAGKIERYIAIMEVRAKDMIKAGANRKFSDFAASTPSPGDDIKKIAQQLEAEAKDIEKTADPEEFKKLKLQKDELQARRFFTQRKAKILAYIKELRTTRKYDVCIGETKHKAITDKGREIISEALTPQLINALKNELVDLGADHLKLGLKTSGGYGETSHKMELQQVRRSGAIKLSDILSEGEQHIVGIAGFLAELQIAGHKCPIVLDDPVCSLDHRYREKVAERLTREATVRQVIVFTHDIAFLLELQSKVSTLENVKFMAQTVRYDDAPGYCSEGLPWHSMSVKHRLPYLDEMLNDMRALYDSDLQEYNRQAGHLYGRLRETWEAAVEEVLFHKTVRRHSGEIRTLNLRYVNVTDDDYKKIFSGMAKCSKWMFGHDKAKALDVNRPMPGEIQNDINTLMTFVKDVNTRSNVLESKRRALLEPEKPGIG